MEPLEIVDKARWNNVHTLLFTSLGLGFFMWGTISSIAPLYYPSVNNVYFILAPIIATIVGDLIFPLLSDRLYGRKRTFLMTMSMYGAGTIIIVASSILPSLTSLSPSKPPLLYLLTLGIVLGVLGVEGEVPVMLSYAAEMMPLKYREKILILAPNFDNVGAMVASGLALLSSALSSSVQLLALSLVAVIGVAFLIVIRVKLPESVRWLYIKGNKEAVSSEIKKISPKVEDFKERSEVRRVSLTSRFLFLVVIGVSQYLTYGLMAFYIGDFYFPSQENMIVFIANLGASVAGFLATLIIDRERTSSFSLFSFTGGFLTIVAILFSLNTVRVSPALFYSLLFANMVFSEFGWAVRTIYEPLLLPNSNRAFLIGMVRLFPITLSSLSVYYSSYLSSPFSYVLYNTVLWALGAGATIWWYLKGYDVKRVSLELTSQSKLPVTK